MNIFEKILLAGLLLQISPAHAQSKVQYLKDPKTGHLSIIASDCKTANEIASSLYAWKVHLGEASATLSPFENKTDTLCTVDVGQMVPQFVAEHHGVSVPNDWPNCWGTTLAAAGIIPYVTESISSGEDIQSWMQAPLCSPVSGKPEAGDIGAVRLDHREVHGFVYVSPNTVFSKNGLSSKYPFALQSFDQMLSETKSEGSQYHIQYYRCMTIAQFKQDMKSVPEKYKKQDEAMKIAEKQMAEKALHCSNGVIDDTKSNLNPIVSAIYALSIKEMDNKKNTASEKLLWKTLNLRAASLENYL